MSYLHKLFCRAGAWLLNLCRAGTWLSNLWRHRHRWLDRCWDLFYPPRCPVCGQKVLRGLICLPCYKQLPFLPENRCSICGRALDSPLTAVCGDCRRYGHVFLQARAVFFYKGDVQRSLYQLKYGGRQEYARFFASLMALTLGDWIRARRVSRIVPIPLHRKRYRERGYNQAEQIALRLGEALGLPVCPGLLRRIRQTAPQKMLNRQQRKKNLDHAFLVTASLLPTDRILLVDDILTTGATADAAALALMERGCGAVFVAAVAVAG